MYKIIISIGGVKKIIDFADVLANNFKTACTPNSADKHQTFQSVYFSNKAACADIENNCFVDVERVDKAINRIEVNMAPGADGLSIKHIVDAHPSIFVILRTLFNIMLHTGRVPNEFGVGGTTPIPKS